MELPYALLFVVFLPYGNFLEIIKNSGFISYPQQITTSFQNISTTEYPGVKWWTFDVFDTNKKMLNHREKHKMNDQPCHLCGKLIKNLA